MKCKLSKSLHFMGEVMIMQDRWKLFSLDRVKSSATMVAQRWKIKKKHWLKRPTSVPLCHSKKKKINGAKNKWFDISYSEFYSSTRSSTHFSVHHQNLFFLISDFLAESLKANKLAKKMTNFTIQLQYTFHFTNLNSFNIENNMLPRHSQKPLWLYKFSGKHISV